MAVTYVTAFILRVVPFWPAMALLSAVSWWVAWHPYLPVRLRPSWRLVGMGVASGLALYAVFFLGALVTKVTPLWPFIERVVDLARGTAPGPVAGFVILFGTSPSEEVLWRGAVYARTARRLGPGWRPLALTTGLYAVFVALSGNPILPLAAIICGTVWCRQRQTTGSLIPGMVSHALWALLMLVYIPGLPRPV
jgi:membrane protease YdiL (CAAX protease family)